jgi:hypothetical protein
MRAIACALLIACGAPAERVATVSAQAPLVLTDVRSVELFLIEGRSTAGDPLACDALADDTPLTRDDLIARAHLLTPLVDLRIPDVAATSDLILLADGYATDTADGARIAHGCADAIRVNARQETPVALILHALP